LPGESAQACGAAKQAAKNEARARRLFIGAYASICSMHRCAAYFYWFFYLTPEAVERS
jgi:hypothetical protein